ncbi:MAG: hypothetical protein L0H31_15660 [Nocardioidaceae bacterium]|nr:hypothetical protein [Nocardioidaceae bacterium]
MRNSTLSFSGLLSAGVLAAATVVGGAGIASAQSGVLSSGSLGSSGSADDAALVLTIYEATPEGVTGTVQNMSAEDAENCAIAVSHADVAAQYEEYFAENGELPAKDSEQWDALQDANELVQNWVAFPGTVDAEGTENWDSGQGPDTAEGDYPAGAWVTCDVDGEEEVAFAYESQGIIGSVQGLIGSLDIGGSLA